MNDSLMDHESPRGGFALVIALGLMAFVLLLLLSITTLVQVETQSAQIQMQRVEAEQAALLGLQVALGELQKAAGPDQRVSATANILGDANNPYTSETTAANGRKHWAGVWDTSGYSPADSDNKNFVRWLVSGNADNLDAIADVGAAPAADDLVIFEAVDAAGTPMPANDVMVEKVAITNAGSSSSESFYAYWVEDQGVKADLAWNEGTFSDDARQQSARLSSAPGVDYGVFASDDSSPFKENVMYPLEQDASNNLWLGNMGKVVSSEGLPVVTGSATDAADWLKSLRHDMTFGSRAVLCDVKHGGLRRDLSLAFEMDGEVESENATLFNQQTDEFVGNGDQLSSPYEMPGVSGMTARHLFRDTPSAEDVFSADITQSATVVRGPSWWLLRDYANLYKRLRTSGAGHALEARAYFPNRTTATDPATEDLMDIHADKNVNPTTVTPVNRETNRAGNYYAYRPVRANYAPVLLGVNAIYSLVYKAGKLQMTVDPFFIVWNPYNTQIAAEKFAITLENGFAGGMRFRHTDGNGVKRYYGRASGFGNGIGSDTSFVDLAKHKSGESGNVSYLLTGLTIGPGEVMIYSPPNDSDRTGGANVLNDELFEGMNYDVSDSGIVFDEFPEYAWELQPKRDPNDPNEKDSSKWVFKGWKPIGFNSTAGPHRIDALFNIASQSGYAIVNIIETSLPTSDRLPDELKTENDFGDQLTGQEYRLNWGGRSITANINTGTRWSGQQLNNGTIINERWPLTYNLSDLSATKNSFGLLSMLTLPTDYDEVGTKMEVFSHLNATPIVRTQKELFGHAPLNVVVKSISKYGINNLMYEVGIDLDAISDGNHGFYGKSYDLADGDTSFPLLDVPKAPLHSLVQLSGANVGTRLFEPTHAIGNSWKPPYIPQDSIYYNPENYYYNATKYTLNDVSWQINDALFDRYYLSGIAPDFAINTTGYSQTGPLVTTLSNFYGTDYKTAKANPILLPYLPESKSASDVVTELSPTSSNSDSYNKLGAYSLINGAFNVNSTSVAAWSALLRGNKGLTINSIQATTDSGAGTPFPLSGSSSETSINNGWEQFSRLSDKQIWDDQGTSEDTSDDTGLAVEIVEQVKTRGPFMSLSDFVNRRIADNSDPSAAGNDVRSYQGTIQEAIEQANINGNQTTGIRAITSYKIPNYSNYYVFPYAGAPYVGNRNNATGVPLEINQANILLPIAAKLSARTDTFKIRAYGEVVSAGGDVIKAVCEATVQRVPEYLDPVDEPWDENDATPLFPTGNALLEPINQAFGRRFEIIQLRWLDQAEI